MKRARHVVLVVFGALLGVGLAIFISSNQEPLQVYFLDQQLQSPTSVWLFALVCALVGMVAPRLLFWGLFWERFQERRKLRRKVATLEREVVRLRDLPLHDLPPAKDAAADKPRPRAEQPRRHRRPEAPAEPFDYDAFLGHTAEPTEAWPQPEILPATEGDDPYAEAFADDDPAVADLDEARIYVSVRDSSARSEEG